MAEIFEKHGVTTTYFKRKKVQPIDVARQMIQDLETSLSNMDKAGSVTGKHSNKDELHIMKETLEVKC